MAACCFPPVQEMPWLMLPYDNREAKTKICDMFNVRSAFWAPTRNLIADVAALRG
jgi:hypothetical protein